MEESTLVGGQLQNGSVVLVLISKASLRWPGWWDLGSRICAEESSSACSVRSVVLCARY